MAGDSPCIVRADGLHIWDAAGRRYLDAVSGAFCVPLGYTRPDLVRAMSGAAERLPFARRATFQNPEATAYEAELLAAAGAPYRRAILTSSGSEAVDAALKISYRYQCAAGHPERRAFGFRPGHYHGATLGALGVTAWRARRAPYEDLLHRRDAAPLAAHILETIPAAGLGAPVPAPGALASVRAECDAADALWIADEVLTGFGRTGALFAWQRLAERPADRGAAPDLVVFGKGAGAGFAPLGGVLVAERVASALESLPAAERFTHHQTYGGNPIACAVGRAVLRAIHEERLIERVRATEAEFRGALEGAAAHPCVRRLTGEGFLLGMQLAEEAARPHPAEARVAERMEAACRARGVLVYAARGWADGALGDFVLLAPPLPSGSEAFAEAAAAVAGAASEVLGG